jgi:hypothetical protein
VFERRDTIGTYLSEPGTLLDRSLDWTGRSRTVKSPSGLGQLRLDLNKSKFYYVTPPESETAPTPN